ncbi:MAG: LamG-like jellyroll fold domain-containing protein [Candidatus Nanohalobium sp.]
MVSWKGQSAIEYLTTYGWMLLVIAIVGGSIFTTVMGSTGIQSVSGLTNADVRVSDFGLNQNGLQLSLRSAAVEQVEIQKVTITDPRTGISADIQVSKTVPIGETTTVNLQDVQTTDTSDTYDLDITYNTGSLNGLVAEGKITGNFGVFNRISLENAKFNRSTNTLQIDVKNTGDNTTNSISYTVEANNTDYTGSLPNLDAGETSQINITTDRTYPLQSVSLNTEGTQFVDSSSGLKCTPTKGLVGYWTFNQEQTQNGWLEDLSDLGVNGSLNGNPELVEGEVGEAYNFDGSDDFLDNFNSVEAHKWGGEDEWAIYTKAEFESTGSNERLIDFGGYQIEIWIRNGDIKGGYYNDAGNWKWTTTSSSKKGLIDLVYWRKGDTQRLYIDGEKVAESSYTSTPNTSRDGGLKRIGMQNNDYWTGKVDEIRVYNNSISESAIKNLDSIKSEKVAVSGCKLTG